VVIETPSAQLASFRHFAASWPHYDQLQDQQARFAALPPIL